LQSEEKAMFDPDRFVADCRTALHSADPAAAIAALLADALRDPQALVDAFAPGADQPGVVPLFRSDSLTVAHVISAPGSRSPIHNHRMWGVIGIYAGQEDNHLYRRGADGLVDDGLRSLRAGDVFIMDPELIHAVANPLATLNGGLHVYGGDLMARPGRSLWDPDSGAEEAYAFERVLAYTARLSA
jgi:predicted metal-dependent enzyme (double-stranded beta helix superfamily)